MQVNKHISVGFQLHMSVVNADGGVGVLVVSTLVHTGTPNRAMFIVRQAQNVAVIPAKVHILYV